MDDDWIDLEALSNNVSSKSEPIEPEIVIVKSDDNNRIHEVEPIKHSVSTCQLCHFPHYTFTSCMVHLHYLIKICIFKCVRDFDGIKQF
jgi:hypothetical protein